MKRYRMVQIGMRNGRQLWRGTGFNPDPGGVTWLGDERVGWRPLCFKWLWERLLWSHDHGLRP